MIGTGCMRCVCRSVSVSNISSSVPKPPGKSTTAAARRIKWNFRRAKYLNWKHSSGVMNGFGCCSAGSLILRPIDYG
jgi:hypothetical protein